MGALVGLFLCAVSGCALYMSGAFIVLTARKVSGWNANPDYYYAGALLIFGSFTLYYTLTHFP